MPGKRSKVKEAFDPNKSDSSDENYDELQSTRSRSRKPVKRSRPQNKKTSQKKRSKRTHGSDISSDDSIASGDEDSFSEEHSPSEVEMDETTGRPKRKAKQIAKSYAESDEDEKILNSDAEQPAKKKRHVVTLKLGPEKMNIPSKTSSGRAGSTTARSQAMSSANATRRATRATTADVELVELSTSGRHGIAVRASESPGPQPQPLPSRSSRASKSVKQPAAIKEAPHENSSYENADEDAPMVETDIVDEGINAASPRSIQDSHDEADDIEDNEPDADADVEMGNVISEVQADADEEEDDDDDEPVTAPGRSRGKLVTTEVDDDDDDDNDDPMDDAEPVPQETTTARRLTRRSGAKKDGAKKDDKEQGSDFEPDHDSADDDLSASDASGGKKKGFLGDDDDDESPVGRSRSARRGKSQNVRRIQDQSDLDDEQSPEKEAAEELQELGRRKRRQDDIQYDQPRNVRAARAKAINYGIKPLEAFAVDEDEAAQEFATPSRNARGKAAANKLRDRSWATTCGPFGGGGGLAPIVGGPWDAAANVDSDSSDDEDSERPASAGPNLGMVSTTAMAGQLLPGQMDNAETAPGDSRNMGQVNGLKAAADIDPLGVDRNIDFTKVGGLDGHIDQLKEMVQMPLLYPEVFMKYNVTPPRGVLFHGPPGTGKTLLARALAAQVGNGHQKISFYMRKGADTLSKWVGEAERQLGLLFEQARKTQPSIIFFDEIDGLAPVRSSKQDQTHSSIVATLLALMDGMDGRGQVIVIGATNRPDSVDPALRRPGRFDREFYFPLPDTSGRLSILNIHTQGWGLSESFKESIADLTKGYGGADMRALCTEATLNAIQRTFPQIYSSNQKLLIDPSKIEVNAKDFMISIKKVVPSSERSTSSGAAPLPPVVEPLLREQFRSIKHILENLLPVTKKVTALQEAMFEQYQDEDHGFGREILQQEFEKARVFRPRFLIKGPEGMGQSYLGGALLHNFEGVHVQNFDLSTIYSDSTRSPEAAIIQLFTEAKRHKPSVIYLPGVDTWFQTVPPSVITTFQGMLKSIATTDPVLVLGIADSEDTSEDLERMFSFSKKNIFTIKKPSTTARDEFFEKIVDYIRLQPKDFPDPVNRKMRKLDILPLAPPPPPHVPSKQNLKDQQRKDHNVLNVLKVRLQPIMDELKKKYRKFFYPAIPLNLCEHIFQEQDPSFIRPDVDQPLRAYELDADKEGVKVLRETASGKFFYNLELVTIEERLSHGYYCRAKDFLKDIAHLVHDNKQLEDRDRNLKAQQLLANVEVDVDTLNRIPELEDCENIYRRQLQRAKEKEEKARKKADNNVALASPVRSDIRQQGCAPFNTPAPSFNGNGSHYADQTPNGSMDVNMSEAETPHSDLSFNGPGGPPDQWSRLAQLNASFISASATDGLHSQQGTPQSSSYQPPRGESPSQIDNSPHTTVTNSSKQTSDGHSSLWSMEGHTGLTSGNRTYRSSNGSSMDVNTSGSSHPPANSQASNSDDNSRLSDLPNTQSQESGPGMSSQPNSSQPRSSGSQSTQSQPPVPAFNDDHGGYLTSSAESQESSQKTVWVSVEHGEALKRVLVDGTKGCTVEMLEQVYRELMVSIWHTRSHFNRSQALAQLVERFKEVVADMEDVRGLDRGSLGMLDDSMDFEQ